MTACYYDDEQSPDVVLELVGDGEKGSCWELYRTGDIPFGSTWNKQALCGIIDELDLNADVILISDDGAVIDMSVGSTHYTKDRLRLARVKLVTHVAQLLHAI